MSFKIIIYLTVILLIHINGIESLRATITAIPSTVIRGGHVALQCQYDMQGAPLYTVKWYRGKHEFYRYSPIETPTWKVFPEKGINVDLSLSNHTQVLLKELEFTMSGNFSCEVSADAPSFSTAYVTTHLEVVYPPDSGPVIRTNKNQYGVGDVLKANCTVPKSKPAANLTFLINNQVMTLATKELHETDDGLEWTELGMILTLSAPHFRGGKMVLRCVANLDPIYAEYATATFVETMDPKPERITSDASVKSISIIPIILLIITMIITTFASLDYEVYSYDYPDSHSETLARELLGA